MFHKVIYLFPVLLFPFSVFSDDCGLAVARCANDGPGSQSCTTYINNCNTQRSQTEETRRKIAKGGRGYDPYRADYEEFSRKNLSPQEKQILDENLGKIDPELVGKNYKYPQVEYRK